jgi:hypothetical protein
MGAWSHTPFGNDTAGDWADELSDAEGTSAIETALDRVLDTAGDYLEAPEAEEAIAAIEVLARLLGQGTEPGELPESVTAWITQHPGAPSPALRDKASRAVQRILAEESELADLWDEGGNDNAWRDNMAALQRAMHG